MNEILRFWPIHFKFEGRMMSVPLGEIINISADSKEINRAAAVIVVRDVHGTDTWRTDSPYNGVMKQWAEALESAKPNQKWEVT